MSWTTFAAVYVVVWWLVLFTILPIGVRSAQEAGEEVQTGHASGAPVAPNMWKKVAATSVITAVVVAILYTLVNMDVFGIRTYITGR